MFKRFITTLPTKIYKKATCAKAHVVFLLIANDRKKLRYFDAVGTMNKLKNGQ